MIEIQYAKESHAPLLSHISKKAKRHWNYPESYYEIWEDELVITEKYIQINKVFIAVYKSAIVGFYSLLENNDDFYSGDVFVKRGYWLEHMFILPEFHNKGIGKKLIEHMMVYCRNNNIPNVLIFVDPFAKGFYEKVGAIFKYNSESSIPGRKIPVYEIEVE